MLQNTRTIPGRRNATCLLVPGGYRPTSNCWPAAFENALWKIGSKLGKSTTVPTGIARTWGRNSFFCCTIVAFPGRIAGTTVPSSGSSHTATPALDRRSFGEAFPPMISTRPVTGPANAATAAATLKQVSQSRIVVISQALARADVSCPDLARFDRENHVRCNTIKRVHRIRQIAGDPSV